MEACNMCQVFREEWGGWTSKPSRGTHGYGSWRNIRMGQDKFLQCIHFDVDSGTGSAFGMTVGVVRNL